MEKLSSSSVVCKQAAPARTSPGRLSLCSEQSPQDHQPCKQRVAWWHRGQVGQHRVEAAHSRAVTACKTWVRTAIKLPAFALSEPALASEKVKNYKACKPPSPLSNP